MSGIIKSVGKAFKKVTKVVKKVALPALAIGAVVLTGGAALGALPSIGALGAKLGLSAGLTSILSTAASGATFGAVGSLLMGKNPIKGATTGLLIGGLTGGIGAIGAAPAASAGQAAAGTATSIGGAAAKAAANAASGAVSPAIAAAPQAIGRAMSNVGGIGSASPTVAALTPAGVAAAPTVAAVNATGATASGGGLLGFLNRNPLLASGLIQGIGSGMVAGEQAKEARRAREQVEANYGDMSALFRLPDGQQASGQDASARYDGAVYGKVRYDPQTGRVVQRA